MLRNREFRQFAILFALMSAASVALGFAISTAAGLLYHFPAAAFGAAFLCLPKSGITASPCSPVKSISCFTMPGGWISVRWMRASFPSCTVKSTKMMRTHPGTERCTGNRIKSGCLTPWPTSPTSLGHPLIIANLILSLLSDTADENERRAFLGETEELLVQMDWLIHPCSNYRGWTPGLSYSNAGRSM